ncbi:MAG: hypothetical protein VR77_07320 [Flavobacteriales bacterium BRH_c54]|nr:MAG: hypothetical protein VR77_07320 [Flavobacteriales bacterium BRH_c54]
MLKKVVIFILYFLIIDEILLQAQEEDKIKWGIETSPYISYSGINFGLQVNGFYKKHSLGIGTKIAFQSSYFPYQTSIGLMVDYKYFIMNNNNIKSYISINYTNLMYDVTNRYYSNKNIIHEYVVSNGFLIKLTKKIWIGNSIGVGGYTERYFNFSEGKKENYIGYNLMLKGLISYEF